MRITIQNDKASLIYQAIDFNRSELKNILGQEVTQYLVELAMQIRETELQPTSYKKVKATKTATTARENKAKEKIRSAVNMMNLQGDKININSVSKVSGVAYNTVKKYKNLLISIS